MLKFSDRIGIVIPTCNKDRKPFLDFLLNRIERQTLKVISVKVVDFPNEENTNDIYLRYKIGINELILRGCDFIVFMEDDDYYPLTYINDMYDAWIKIGRPCLLGSWPTRYYHIIKRTYRVYPDLAWCSAHCSAISPKIDINMFDEENDLFDKRLWEYNTGKKVILERHMVSIKHGIGMTGNRIHQTKNMEKDNDFIVLKSWVDKEAFDFYMSIPGVNHG
jgi:hypothetical protein